VEFAGGAALNISQHKNDAGRKGAHKRFGKSKDPSLDFVAQMADFHAAAGMAVSPRCLKDFDRQNGAVTARHCGQGQLGTSEVSTFPRNPPPTWPVVSDWTVSGLGQAGLDTTLFSGVCARGGGLSTAIEAGVPEVITWMQSGHAQDKAARRYVELKSPKLLYATWAAFQL